MPSNKSALIRYRVIDNCLTNKYRPYPTKEDLREACEETLYGSNSGRISISTVEKDLQAMRFDSALGYDAPIAYHKFHKGYYYSEEGYTIKKVPLGEEDIEALRFAAMTLFQFKDIPIFKTYSRAFEKVVEGVALSEAEGTEDLTEHMLFQPVHADSGTEHMLPLLRAIRSKRRVEMDYSSFQSRKRKTYRLEPFLLKEYDHLWYVVGRDVEANKVKTFGLNRITDIRTTEDYCYNSDFDAQRYFKHSVGITHFSTEPQLVQLKVQRPQSFFLQAKPIHSSQELIDVGEEYDVIQFEVILSHELINTILAWCPHIEVLAPASLKERLTARLSEALALNS